MAMDGVMSQAVAEPEAGSSGVVDCVMSQAEAEAGSSGIGCCDESG